jgi:hypothetical protein
MIFPEIFSFSLYVFFTNSDIEALGQVRDSKPAEPIGFE